MSIPLSLPETDEADMSRPRPTSSARAVWPCEYVGVKHVLAVRSGIAALQ